MQDALHPETPGPSQLPRRCSLLIWIFVAAVALVFAIFFLLGPQRPSPTLEKGHLPFGTAEQTYAPKIQLDHVSLSRAENFLHQQVTTLSGRVTNAGDRPLANVEVTVEFFDDLHQVILRESRAVLVASVPPLAPGEDREFEISVEHIPSSWDLQRPAVRVTGILFAPSNR